MRIKMNEDARKAVLAQVLVCRLSGRTSISEIIRLISAEWCLAGYACSHTTLRKILKEHDRAQPPPPLPSGHHEKETVKQEDDDDMKDNPLSSPLPLGRWAAEYNQRRAIDDHGFYSIVFFCPICQRETDDRTVWEKHVRAGVHYKPLPFLDELKQRVLTLPYRFAFNV